MKTYTFHVSGTHCASCKILIEDILSEQAGVTRAEVMLAEKLVKVDMDSDVDSERLAQMLSVKLEPHGYRMSADTVESTQEDATVIWKAIPIGLGFLALFFLLQESGILNIGLGNQTTPVTSFIIGLIASVSSCLAIVGGLVLSLSAKVSQDNKSDTKNFLWFHAGRLGSFALLGGALGALGGALGVSLTFTALLGLVAALVMIMLGLNLVGVFTQSKVTLPAGVFNFFKQIEHTTFTPLILGFATFFLPCGFTQAMQIAALGSGSFMSGFMIMLMFALGTLPVLLVLSFGSASFARSTYAPLFFKSAGVVVIGLGLFALLSGLAALGVITPLFSI